MSDAFLRAADAFDSTQVVLIFPTLQEEMQNSQEEQKQETQKLAQLQEQEALRKKEEEEREKLKTEWLNLLFTQNSVAAMSPEGPVTFKEWGNKTNPTNLIIWVGDNPKVDEEVLENVTTLIGKASLLLTLAWPKHPAGEAFSDVNLKVPEIQDGSWYLRDRVTFENQDLDMLHDVELLGRSIVEAVEP